MAIYMSRMEKATTMFLEGWARLGSTILQWEVDVGVDDYRRK